MEETREVDYRKLQVKAFRLSQLIYAEMDKTVAGSGDLTSEWHELHALGQVASALYSSVQRQAARVREQAETPVPYTLAGPDDPRAPWGEPITPDRERAYQQRLDAQMHAAELDDLDADTR